MSDSRVIFINGQICEEVAAQVIPVIKEFNRIDEHNMAHLNDYEPEPIEIYINSVGGSAWDGFAIIAAMESSITPIITHGTGVVASMALAIFAKGDYRVVNRYARLMYHGVAYGQSGKLPDHKAMYEESKVTQKLYDSLFDGMISNETMADVVENKKDLWISTQEAVDCGLAHAVTGSNPIREELAKLFIAEINSYKQEVEESEAVKQAKASEEKNSLL